MTSPLLLLAAAIPGLVYGCRIFSQACLALFVKCITSKRRFQLVFRVLVQNLCCHKIRSNISLVKLLLELRRPSIFLPL